MISFANVFSTAYPAMMQPFFGSDAHRSKSCRDTPLWSIPGDAKTTDGPLSSKLLTSMPRRLRMCLNAKGLPRSICERMRPFIMLAYVWYTRRARLAILEA